MTSAPISPWLARGLYLFGLALVVTAAIDLFTTVWPLRPGEMAWRYGFLGLAAGYLQTPTLGLVVIIGTAISREHPTVLRAVALLCMLVSVTLLGAAGLFGLDVLAMREIRSADMQSAVVAGGAFQGAKYLIGAFVLALLGYGSHRTAAPLARAAARPPGIVSASR